MAVFVYMHIQNDLKEGEVSKTKEELLLRLAFLIHSFIQNIIWLTNVSKYTTKTL